MGKAFWKMLVKPWDLFDGNDTPSGEMTFTVLANWFKSPLKWWISIKDGDFPQQTVDHFTRNSGNPSNSGSWGSGGGSQVIVVVIHILRCFFLPFPSGL